MKQVLVKVFGLSVIGLLLLTSACSLGITMGSGVLSSEIRKLDTFSALSLAGSGTVTVVRGTDRSVKIDAEDNLIPMIKTTVNNGTLSISPENVWPSKPMNYTVTIDSMEEIVLAGSGDIIMSDQFTNSNFSVVISGSGNVDCKVRVINLTATITGSGAIKASGSAVKENLIITGSGDIDTSAVTGKDGDIEITGSGNCKAALPGSVKVSIMGSGSAVLTLSPSSLTQSILGTGTVTIGAAK